MLVGKDIWVSFTINRTIEKITPDSRALRTVPTKPIMGDWKSHNRGINRRSSSVAPFLDNKYCRIARNITPSHHALRPTDA